MNSIPIMENEIVIKHHTGNVEVFLYMLKFKIIWTRICQGFGLQNDSDFS